MNERLQSSATELQSIKRVSISLEIAIDGNRRASGANWGVAVALIDSVNEMESVAMESIDRRFQEFRAVSTSLTLHSIILVSHF
jgi:hypothetical protein